MFDTNLLNDYSISTPLEDSNAIANYQQAIENVFALFSINARIIDAYYHEPSLVYDVALDKGARLNSVIKLREDIELNTGCQVTIKRSRSNLSAVNIILRKNPRFIVGLKKILSHPAYTENKSKLTIAAGTDDEGNPIIIDLNESNLFVFGTTGAGKTVFLDDVILSLINKCSPAELSLTLIDIKGVDLRYYNGIPYMNMPAVDNRTEAVYALAGILDIIEKRRILFASKGVKTFEQYNQLPKEQHLSNIVVVIDEYRELLARNDSDKKDTLINKQIKDEVYDIRKIVQQIASSGRSFGVRIVIATQHQVSSDIENAIQNNVNYRVRFSVYNSMSKSSKDNSVRSRKLLGNGDMQFERTSGVDSDEERILHGQACYVSGDEIKRIVKTLK